MALPEAEAGFNEESIICAVSKNNNALSWKLNQARIDNQPHNSSSLASSPGAISRRDELTKRQYLLLAIGFHDLNLQM